MKAYKIFAGLLICILAALMPMCIFAQDADSDDASAASQIKITIGSNTADVNGVSYQTDVAPYIQEQSDCVMVPLRVAALAVSGEDVTDDNTSTIVWNGASKTASINYGSSTIQFMAESKAYIADGTPHVMENNAKAEIKNSRMFIPVRELCGIIGADVEWIAEENSVVITMK